MDMTWDTIYFSVFLWKLDLRVGKNPGRYFDLCVYSYFFCQYGRWHQCSVKIYIYSEQVLPQKGWKKENKQAVSWHHVFRVQWSPCPPTLWGASRTPSSPPSWGTHAPHRAPPPNGWTTSVLLPVHETQNGPHQWCIHLSLWWPLRQMVSARKILFCLMNWIARCPFSFFGGLKMSFSVLTNDKFFYFCEMESVVKLECIHLFSAFELMAALEPMIWFMYVCFD